MERKLPPKASHKKLGQNMTFDFSVSTPSGPQPFAIEPGTSILFVGANGGGKTRLAVLIEETMGDRAHRISAHRALALNPSVHKIGEQDALRGLRLGYAQKSADLHYRTSHRWGSNAAISLLNDFDFLVQSLFADQGNTSLQTHNNARAGSNAEPSFTKFEALIKIWQRVLSHRELHVTGDNIQVSVTGARDQYSATDMSDGERAVFYLIGQTLVAAPDSLIIFDEPELHIHRSIMARLWDELEAARPDCGMVLITHDLEFAASRKGPKYVLRDYAPGIGWSVKEVPEESGFDEEIATLILGSRNPVLFVEGRSGSLDRAVYRACYPSWTVIPRGSCEEVIHAVVTMRANSILTRVTCAGVVDADDYSEEEAQKLETMGIGILPVSEIENLFLLPAVVRAIAAAEGFVGEDLEAKVGSSQDELFAMAAIPKNKLSVVMRYTRRRIDRMVKKIDLTEAKTAEELTEIYATKTAALDVQAIAKLATESIERAVEDRDVAALLRWFDNKGILAIACKAKGTSVNNFEQWIVRAMRNGSAPNLEDAIRAVIPVVNPT